MVSKSEVAQPDAANAPSDVAVRVQNVTLRYRTKIESASGLRGNLLSLGRGKRTTRVVDAVSDVTFDVARGGVLGIIGNNGAGKSTLVRLMSGIIPPTEGRIEVHGRVNTVLTLGLGFNVKLTGYENIMLGGLASGYTREEIEARRPAIAEFTELGDFLAMPVQTYSAGMRTRLGFAIATHFNPDVLIIDEALSAGDARFKGKAVRRVRKIIETARTVVLVSHALGTVSKLCTDAIWMNEGRLVMHGKPDDVITAYTEENQVDANAVTTRQDF